MQHTYPHFSSPLEIGGLTLSNRIVMPPLVIWQSGQEGLVHEAHLAHYRESAGPGLIIAEAACVASNGRLAATQIGIFGDEQLPGLTALASTIADTGAVPGIQIHHAGAQSTREKNWGEDPVVVSLGERSPEGAVELDEAGIRLIISQFGDAAERAVSAGFKLIEIHGAHGYLGSQFLSPRHNKRSDAWGGSLENRVRFLQEVTREVVSRVGDRAVIACRLGVADQVLPIEEGIRAARILIDAGVQLLHVSNAGGMPKLPDGGHLPDSEDGLSALFLFACRVRSALADLPSYNFV